MSNKLTTLKQLSYDDGFDSEEPKEKRMYGCFCDGIRVFNIFFDRRNYYNNDKDGHWWIEECFFPSKLYRIDTLGEHPKNTEIGLYLRVPMKTKAEVMDGCENLFKIYTGLFFDTEYNLKK